MKSIKFCCWFRYKKLIEEEEIPYPIAVMDKKGTISLGIWKGEFLPFDNYHDIEIYKWTYIIEEINDNLEKRYFFQDGIEIN